MKRWLFFLYLSLAGMMLAAEMLYQGPRAYTDRSFLPDTVNTLMGQLASPAGDTTMVIEFIDEMENAREVKQPLDVKADGSFSVKIAPFTDALAVSFTVQDSRGGFPAWRIIGIERDKGRPPLEPNYWQASWIVPYTEPGAPPRKGGYIYYVKEFELDLSQVAKAACQYIGSNNGTAYINGTDLGRTYGWATPKAVDDVLPLLRNGKNVFGGDAFIPDRGTATFMGELTLCMKDGTVKYIASDTDWLSSETLQPGWGKPDFDHSNWKKTMSEVRPPQLPYGETRYRNYAPVPEIRFAGVGQWSGAAGTSVQFDLTAPLASMIPNTKVWLRLMHGDREFYRMPLSVTCVDGKLQLKGKLDIPSNALAATYRVELESRSFTFPDPIGSLTITEGEAPITPLVAEVRKINGTPTLHLNGKPVPTLLQRSAINVRNNTACYRFTSGIDREGCHLVELNLSFRRLWKPDGTIDTDELDLYLQSALFYAPHSCLVVFFNTDAPEWYLNKYPGERFISNLSTLDKISYASQQYRRDSVAFLGRIMDFLKSRPYYNFIAGIGLDGGDDGQFMQWAGNGRQYVGDYSDPMKKYFHAYLQAKYGSIDRLNAEWKTAHSDFSAIAIPSMERRRGDEEHAILDPIKDADIIDFNRAFSSCVVDLISDYAATVKKATERTRIVAAYYGKFFSIAGILQWGEFDIERVLANPDFDYLVAVDYFQRPVGKPHEHAAPPASYRLHNKIFVDEADIRTYIAGAARWAKTSTLFEFTSQARKMFIKSWVNGMGLHWYDLHGGMFENDALQRTIGNIQKIADVNPARTVVPAEIALIADEKSFTYTTYTRRKRFNLRQQSAFGYLGAPYDVWFISDLGKPGFPEYKMYVFLNAVAPTPEQRQAIESLKRDGKLLVFLHNSGYIDGRTKSVENVSRLTGIEMAESGPLVMSMRFTPGDGGELFQRVKKVLYASGGNADTAAVVSDPKALAIGSFVKTEQFKPMAYKKFADWTSFYSTVGLLPLDLWRELARSAGVHFYVDNDPDAIVYIGSDLLGIHSANGGVKTLDYPQPHTFIDAVTGKTVAENTRNPQITLIPGETRILRLK